MGEQVLRQRRRLGTLHVGVAGKGRLDVLPPPVEQGLHQSQGRTDRSLGLRALPQSKGHRRLVVAAAGGVQPPTRVADLLGELPLDPGVDILVRAPDLELAPLDAPEHRAQAGEDGGGRVPVDDPGLEQHPGVRQRADQVRGGKPVVEGKRPRVRVDDRIDLRVERAAPQAGRSGPAGLPAQAAASSSACARIPTARSISGS